jgi:ribosomal protein S18 acetylase RimI-like enzyme
MEALIRTFGEGDVEFALTHTRREDWDATAELFEACLAHDPDGCFIAEADDLRVGMVTTTRHRHTAWIGNLIVAPEYRKQGLGGRLMTHAIDYLARQGVQTIRLEADPPGIKLYRRLGFVDEFESLRFELQAHEETTAVTAKHVTPADLPDLTAFDAEYFGDQRDRLLRLLHRQAGAAYGLRQGERLRGYVLAIRSRFGIRIGPLVATSRDVAEALLQSVLAQWQDTTIVLGVPSPNQHAVKLFESYGFERTPSSFRMVYGEPVAFGRPENIFAIANGAMG